VYTVILADDEPYILQGLEKKIDWTGTGFTIVGKASDGEMCLSLIDTCKPDLVITDIRMPGINGLQMMEKIRSRNDETLVIFMSGYSEFEYAREALELGALSYLLKPIGKKDLSLVLQKAREKIELKKSENRTRAERAADDMLDFLANLPIGIDPNVITEKLGLAGKYDTYLCIAEEIDGADSIVPRCCSEQIECITLNPASSMLIHIINLPASKTESFVRTISRSLEGKSGSVGISSEETQIHKLSEMIRSAKSACFSSFVNGQAGCYCSPGNKEPVLATILQDFEMLFSLGNEGKLHRLIDEFKALSVAENPAMQEIVMFFNGIIDQCNHYSTSRRIPFYADTPVTDSEQLYRKYSNLQNMVEHLHDVVHELFESTAHGALIRDSSADTVVAIKQYIRKNLDTDLFADALATIFHAEKNQLASLFKSETGKSLTEFVREARIDHACFLLQHTRISIQEISDMCGFSDYFYFAKQFRRVKGITATEYRKKRTIQH
jgi:two-component system, response regulator YesN